ncbi:uncharacterized protein BX664DRAFT_319869 [Halteromyces radiatus]|uniref:uncharacterized protein n=1 Tax=Halteromyces radiatus TaxID=101107 RepID=UPI002220F6FB|nr:uncharacterized protein BX664DRAFT_319869 [Halteromyces radiatus]KAI8098892.1 hypothetical protein BX664DRAFT_319869 [Halteromyces radiatus]
MYATTSHTKRFPSQCRFFTQGNCRAGQECQFAHTLPLKGTPHSHTVPHTVLFGDEATLDLEPESIQKAIRDLELDQLDRAYKDHIQKTTMTDTCTCLLFDSLTCGSIELLIPYHYPDLPCSIRLDHDPTIPQHIKQQMNETFESFQHQLKHMTLVQQIDRLCSSFSTTTTTTTITATNNNNSNNNSI